MKLVIDRGVTIKQVYTIEFGVDFDILIGKWTIPFIKCKDTMAELDKLVTGSVSKVFCVLHIKHPLLLEDTAGKEIEFFGFDYKRKLREYFAVRLQHRRYDVDLYEIGKRLF